MAWVALGLDGRDRAARPEPEAAAAIDAMNRLDRSIAQRGELALDIRPQRFDVQRVVIIGRQCADRGLPAHLRQRTNRKSGATVMSMPRTASTC